MFGTVGQRELTSFQIFPRPGNFPEAAISSIARSLREGALARPTVLADIPQMNS